MTKIQEIREKIGVCNKTINNFIEAFDIRIYERYYVGKPNYFGDFRDYQYVSDEFAQILYSLEKEIIEFYNDYYKWKTPLEISKTTGLEVELITSYLNKNIKSFIEKELNNEKKWINYNIKDLKNNTIVDSTKLKKISSFKIMRDIQIEARKEKIKKLLNGNC